MKKIVFFSLCMFLFLNSCALMLPKKTTSILWPDDINYMEAVCELSISWNTMQYSGDMSLKLDYPDTLSMEVYGPFGDTVFSIEKDKVHFILKAGNEKITDENRFFDIFKMKIEDFMKDISMKENRQQNGSNMEYIQRQGYRVIYYLKDEQSKVCWVSPEGTICIKFLEANFEKGQSIGKGSDRSM